MSAIPNDAPGQVRLLTQVFKNYGATPAGYSSVRVPDGQTKKGKLAPAITIGIESNVLSVKTDDGVERPVDWQWAYNSIAAVYPDLAAQLRRPEEGPAPGVAEADAVEESEVGDGPDRDGAPGGTDRRDNGGDGTKIPPEMVVVPRSTWEWSRLKDKASEALGRWLLDEPGDDLWTALTPAAVLGELGPEQGLSIRDYLAEIAPGEVAAFAERWRIGHSGTALPIREVGQADRLAVTEVLEAAWPGWFGWSEAPRTYAVQEFRYDLQSDRVWDITIPMAVSDNAFNASVPRHQWPRNPTTDKPVKPAP